MAPPKSAVATLAEPAPFHGKHGIVGVQVKVRASIPSNLKLYQKLGYRVLGREPYPIGTDQQITLTKNLTT